MKGLNVDVDLASFKVAALSNRFHDNCLQIPNMGTGLGFYSIVWFLTVIEVLIVCCFKALLDSPEYISVLPKLVSLSVASYDMLLVLHFP